MQVRAGTVKDMTQEETHLHTYNTRGHVFLFTKAAMALSSPMFVLFTKPCNCTSVSNGSESADHFQPLKGMHML